MSVCLSHSGGSIYSHTFISCRCMKRLTRQANVCRPGKPLRQTQKLMGIRRGPFKKINQQCVSCSVSYVTLYSMIISKFSKIIRNFKKQTNGFKKKKKHPKTPTQHFHKKKKQQQQQHKTPKRSQPSSSSQKLLESLRRGIRRVFFTAPTPSWSHGSAAVPGGWRSPQEVGDFLTKKKMEPPGFVFFNMLKKNHHQVFVVFFFLKVRYVFFELMGFWLGF